MVVDRSSLNSALAASVVSSLDATANINRGKAAVERGKAALWYLAGCSLLLLGLGGGIGAALYGGSFLPALKNVTLPPQPQPPPIIIHDQAAASEAPRQPPAQVQSVTLFGLGGGTGTALAGGSSVPAAKIVSPPPPVTHDQAADEAPRPPPAQVQSDSPPASKAKVVTNYTTFHTVPFGIGEVQTAWNYDESTQTHPTTQYCLYVVHPANQPSSYVSIGIEGHMDLPSHGIAGVDLKAAYANCVWTATDTVATK